MWGSGTSQPAVGRRHGSQEKRPVLEAVGGTPGRPQTAAASVAPPSRNRGRWSCRRTVHVRHNQTGKHLAPCTTGFETMPDVHMAGRLRHLQCNAMFPEDRQFTVGSRFPMLPRLADEESSFYRQQYRFRLESSLVSANGRKTCSQLTVCTRPYC